MTLGLIHCALAHGRVWAPLLDAMGRPDAVSVELPGHGGAPDWDESREYQGQAVDLASELLLRRCDLIGHSFGATVALRFALEQPDRVSALALIEPVFFAAAKAHAPKAYAAHRAAFRPVVEAFEADDRDAAARAFTEIWGGGQRWEDTPTPQRRYILDRIHLIPAQAPAIEEDAAGLLAPGRLEALDLPVVLVEGDRSPPVIGAIHGALAARLPDARRVTIPGAGHMSPLTHPREVAEALS